MDKRKSIPVEGERIKVNEDVTYEAQEVFKVDGGTWIRYHVLTGHKWTDRSESYYMPLKDWNEARILAS